MEVFSIVSAVFGGLSLVAVFAEIRNRAILRAERKKAETERKAAEAAEAAKPTAWECRNAVYSRYKALENSSRHIGAPEHRRPY